ncbi:MAG: 50S ribosomal protein L23 [Desulfobacteraceae bacterium IS3]|nr:MAG: 50S ribosomal protein L23 [Desulfobacteraceae bacterium IS3]HAO22053.1 50S ribosomal protein L23 [Desulfobacteraceae bacterium]
MKEHDIIRRPLMTEKTNIQKDEQNQYTFEVDRNSNRIEIRKAVERIFNVRVANVRTIQVKGKVKMRGRVAGKRRDWKKAMVTLIPGERIPFFEGA